MLDNHHLFLFKVQALSRLGFLVASGIGGERDDIAGLTMLKEAAEKDPNAAHNLGVFYLERKQEALAFEAFLKAADQGCAPALFNLGNCHLQGIGCTKDEEKAISCFLKAADAGHARAMAQLGQMYSESDPTKSYEYFLAAVRHGFTTDDI